MNRLYEKARRWKIRLVPGVTLGILFLGADAPATEIRWQPVEASGTGLSYEIIDNEATEGVPSEIRLSSGGEDAVVTFEMHINDWGYWPVGAYNGAIDPESITSDWGAPILPLGWPDVPLEAAYIDLAHPGYIFRSLPPWCVAMPFVAIDPYLEWGGSIMGGCGAEDEGDNNYGGTLVLEVPAGAEGTYTVEWLPFPRTFLNYASGATVPVNRVSALIVLPTDCNDNGNPDDEDIALGTSEDCNGNDTPDECDVAVGSSGDCNVNFLPDECDLAAGDSQDCNATGIPDECEDDCNENGLADECDLATGTSPDDNGNGVPDECEVPKNRYLTFASAGAGPPAAYRVEMTASTYFPTSTGVLGWIGPPDHQHVSRVVEAPLFSDSWPAFVRIADCEIVPAAVYEIRGTPDGVAFGEPVVLTTVPQPIPPPVKWWADVAGMHTHEYGWTPPNGVVNFDDIEAVIRVFEGDPGAPPWTWVDVADEVPDIVVNMTDVQLVILAFESAQYPFSDPAECP